MDRPLIDHLAPESEPAWHAGEIAMQRATGSAERMAEIGPLVLRDHMPEQHRELFRKLPMLLVGSVDAQRRPWASMLIGAPGFVHDPDDRHLRIDARPAFGDALGEQLQIGATLGLLGIELQTRRRNRMNGTVVERDARGFTVEVDQSFGNCPQYIQQRAPHWVDTLASYSRERPIERGAGRLGDAAKAIVAAADTFFIATAAAPGATRRDGVDVSHRGGPPGFVRIDDATDGSVLTFPDFRGNHFFNTLGNIVVHPHAGLLIVDWTNGDLLQLTGDARVILDPREATRYPGALRLVELRVREHVRMPGAVPMRWSEPRYASQLAMTGPWSA